MLTLSLVSASAPLRAQNDPFEDLLAMDLADLMNVRVTTASRHEQQLRHAPAIITVLDGRMLRHEGVRSVAEALSRVPGFYVIDDGVGQSVTVRGIGSGQRAYGRTLKVLLDGQPLGLRSNANQFLGPELIPMSAIDRVEVIRGPTSALYGADAYLGVINILTRHPDDQVQVRLNYDHTDSKESGLGAELQAAHKQDRWETFASTGYADEDRSGRELPTSSPDYADYTDTRSANDNSRPAVLFARVGYQAPDQQHFLSLHASERNTDGEFLDFGALSHENHLVVRQQTLSWSSQWDQPQQRQVNLRAAYAWGGNTDDERLSLGDSSLYPVRDFGYRSGELALETQFSTRNSHWLLGTDGSWDEEDPFDVYTVNRQTGEKVLVSSPAETSLFRNLGLYWQYQYHLSDTGDWELALNWRHDHHNRYGEHNSYRIGLTGSLWKGLETKLLYGTSFKAPNASELYAEPLFSGDSLGNPDLRIERANTWEGQLLWQARSDLLLTLTLYQLETHNLIELQPYNFNSRWTNRGTESGHGVETELRWRQGAQEIGFTSSWHDTTVKQEIPLLPQVEVPTASAPRLLLMLDWHYRLAPADFGWNVRYASARRASEANIDANLREVYQLPAYSLWRFYATRDWGAHRINLVLDNAFDKHFAEPGYGGVDLPGQRRSIRLSWTWSH